MSEELDDAFWKIWTLLAERADGDPRAARAMFLCGLAPLCLTEDFWPMEVHAEWPEVRDYLNSMLC